MEGTRKQAISLRLNTADLRKVKKLSQRLGVRNSEVIRFAVKTMLARVAPLCDDSMRGRALLPVFIEAGNDILHHFDLDTARLAEIVNGGVSKDQQIEPDDLQLIAMAGIPHSYAKLRLNKVTPGLARERQTLNAEDPRIGHLRGYLDTKYADISATRDVTAK